MLEAMIVWSQVAGFLDGVAKARRSADKPATSKVAAKPTAKRAAATSQQCWQPIYLGDFI